ncbi:M23 family metallopeptidase [Leifsonia aquatica]|uniref:M23 family metallopeptidase n=1 Tax=Leifsonia aquatica TaxID=144185 RepID=UPI0037F2DDCC
MKLMEPLAPPGRYDAADPFGNYGGRAYPHTGSDWNGVPAGTAAMAIGTGVVVNKQWHAGNGNTVTVKLPDGHYYAYLHLNAEAPVAVGQTVTIGQVIGYVGNTGTNSQGAHLHITVSDSPSAYAGLGNKIDPWAFIQAHKNDTDPVDPGPSIPLEGDMKVIRNSANGSIGLIGEYYVGEFSGSDTAGVDAAVAVFGPVIGLTASQYATAVSRATSRMNAR